jgi:hypothetical protein
MRRGHAFGLVCSCGSKFTSQKGLQNHLNVCKNNQQKLQDALVKVRHVVSQAPRRSPDSEGRPILDKPCNDYPAGQDEVIAASVTEDAPVAATEDYLVEVVSFGSSYPLADFFYRFLFRQMPEETAIWLSLQSGREYAALCPITKPTGIFFPNRVLHSPPDSVRPEPSLRGPITTRHVIP